MNHFVITRYPLRVFHYTIMKQKPQYESLSIKCKTKPTTTHFVTNKTAQNNVLGLNFETQPPSVPVNIIKPHTLTILP
jgi:nitrate reductase cytochrome c-type subunit